MGIKRLTDGLMLQLQQRLIWERYFTFRELERRSCQFGFYIQTDGVAISFKLLRPKRRKVSLTHSLHTAYQHETSAWAGMLMLAMTELDACNT